MRTFVIGLCCFVSACLPLSPVRPDGKTPDLDPAVRSAPVQNYRIWFSETTGLPWHVSGPEGTVAVALRSDSSPLPLQALLALNPEILYLSSSVNRLIVRGQLGPMMLRTPDRPELAQSESYRELRLLDWHISAPFYELYLAAPDESEEEPYEEGFTLSDSGLTRVRDWLNADDFDDFPGKAGIAFDRFIAP